MKRIPIRRQGADANALAMTILHRVPCWAGGFRRRLAQRGAYSQEDAEADCYLGIHYAAERYDPTRGTTFHTYAFQWARQSMQRAYVRKRHVVVRPYLAGHIPTSETRRERIAAREIQIQAIGLADSRREWEPSVTDDPLEGLLRTEEIAAVRDSLRFLPASERRILLERVDGVSLREIADRLGVTKERVRQRQAKAFRKVRRLMQESCAAFAG